MKSWEPFFYGMMAGALVMGVLVWAFPTGQPKPTATPVSVRAATPSPAPKRIAFSTILRRAKAVCQDVGMRFERYSAASESRTAYVACDNEDFRSTYIDLPPETFR